MSGFGCCVFLGNDTSVYEQLRQCWVSYTKSPFQTTRDLKVIEVI